MEKTYATTFALLLAIVPYWVPANDIFAMKSGRRYKFYVVPGHAAPVRATSTLCILPWQWPRDHRATGDQPGG